MSRFAPFLRSRMRSAHYVWFARVPFLVASVGGGTALIAMKAIGFSQLSVTFVAIAFLLGYALSVQSIRILRLREDLLGDNCYYLGFLYTLFSLAWALYEFGQNGNTSLIVANFGLGLGSTIVGVLLRVTINQSRKDAIETEQDARIELSDAVIRMRNKIDDAVVALDSFCRTTQQTAMEQINASAIQASGALESGVEKVGEASTKVLERIEKAFEEFRAHAAQLNEVSAGTVKAMSAVLRKIEKIEAPSDLVSSRFTPLLEVAEKAAQQINQQLIREEEMMKETSERRERIGDGLDAFISQLGTVSSSLSTTVQAVEKTFTSARDVSQQVAELADQSKKSVEGQIKVSKELSDGTHELMANLVAGQKRMAEELRGSLDEVTGALQSHNKELGAELERTRRMVATTGSALGDLADSVVERLS